MTYLSIGYMQNNLNVDFQIGLLLVFVSTLMIPIVYTDAEKYSKPIMLFFGLGLFLRTSIVVGFSYFSDPGKYGYGMLFDPLTMSIVNSPSFSNNYALIFCIFLYLFYASQSIIAKTFSAIILVVSLFGALFLAGRSFFIITGFFLLFFLFKVMKFKNILSLLLLLIGLVSLFFIFYDTIAHAFPTLFERFSGEKLKSGRYALWAYALTQAPLHPFGGFIVPVTLDHVKWFHNFWLDTAAESGWVPLFFLFMANLLTLSFVFQTKKSFEIFILWLLSVVFLLIFAQDVIMQGNIRLLLGYLVFSSLMIKLIYNPIYHEVKRMPK
jgi:hypothetical protein